MNALKYVIEEEYQRLIELKNLYMQDLKGFPKGSISNKKRYNKAYSYLVYRNAQKVIFKYIENVDSPKAHALDLKIKKRKRIEQLLKKVENGIKYIKKLHYD